MSYSEEYTQTFRYFTDADRTVIEDFLKSKGHTWDKNTVCGDCCGMYEEEFWVNGIGGNFPKEHQDELRALLEQSKIEAHIEDYTISATSSDL